jgi:hypothetical protein
MGRELAPLPEKTPESNVPLLLGIEGYQRMVKIFCIGLLPIVVLATFSLISLLK